MAAPTETYVDPAIAGNSGTGTAIDPYGDVQYALNTMARDATNGDRINIKAGTDEVLGAALSLATYGTPTAAAPLVFQGYTAAAGDGGIGGIDGAATYTMIAPNTLDYIWFVDMHLHNSGAQLTVYLDDYCGLVNCEIDTSTTALVYLDEYGYIAGCYLHDWGNAYGLAPRSHCTVIGCYVDAAGSAAATAAIEQSGLGTLIAYNIVTNATAMPGINLSTGGKCIGNTVFAVAGTKNGISAGADNALIVNNYVEGCSGVGGVGINVAAAAEGCFVASNAVYNCTTPYTYAADLYFGDGNNDTLVASALTNPAAGDFSVNTDAKVKADGWPTGWPRAGNAATTDNNLDKGAAQRAEAGGGMLKGDKRGGKQ